MGFTGRWFISGGHIAEINCVRKHFSAVKGGRLGMAAAAMPGVTMLVSDVPEGQLDALASGPTLPDRSTEEQCREILSRYQLLEKFPAAVREFFASEQWMETPKPEVFSPRVFTLLSAEGPGGCGSARGGGSRVCDGDG